MRLEKENSVLRPYIARAEQLEIVRSELEDTNARKAELETELRLANQRLLELGGRIEDLEAELQRGQGGAVQFKKYMEKARTVCGHIWIERHLKLNNYLYR
jgi:chromosome segregation ATPase